MQTSQILPTYLTNIMDIMATGHYTVQGNFHPTAFDRSSSHYIRFRNNMKFFMEFHLVERLTLSMKEILC